MAINPPSDIVHDVARAVDPMKYQAATKRLADIANAANPGDFGEAYNAAAARSVNAFSTDPYSIRTTFRNDAAMSGGDKTKGAYQQFEAFILQSFVESMLPKDAEATFGKGTAGGIWKSMMAEQIGAQIAKAGGVGIAKKLFAVHPPEAAGVASNTNGSVSNSEKAAGGES